MPTRIQFRRDTSSNWTSSNPILLQGELGIETDTSKAKIGDGTTSWTSLGYFPVETGDISSVTAGTGLTGGGTSGAVTLAIDSTVATLSGTQTLTNKTLTDSNTFFQDQTDNTKKMQFELSGITTGTTRTLTVPNINGTIITSGDTSTVTNTMLAGSIANAKLTNSAVTIGTTSVSLGATASSISGLTSLGVTGSATIGTDLTVTGNLTVNGTTTTINSTVVTVDDIAIELGAVTTPTDVTANSGGIVLKGATDKSITWLSATTSWTSSENFNLLTGKTYKINGTDVLTSTQVLGKAVPTGVIVGTTDTQTLTNKTFTDSTTSFQDDVDNTKKMQFQLSGITTATTRTLTIPNVNGTIVTTGDTGTVSNTMLANSSMTLNGTLVSLGGTATIPASISNALTIGTGLSGTSYNGSAPVTIAIDSTVTTLTGTQTLTNKTLTSPIINTGRLRSPQEPWTIAGTSAPTTVNYDIVTQSVLYYDAASTGNFTVNFRGNSVTTLNSILAVGNSTTIVLLNTNTTLNSYPTAYQIDGVSVTPKWIGGTAPTSGNGNAIDSYTFTIVKTSATPTYEVLASQVKFA